MNYRERLRVWLESITGRVLVLSSLFFFVAALSLNLGYWTSSTTLRPPFKNIGGYQWVAQLEPTLPLPGVFVVATDSMESPTASRLVLADLEGVLGPAHSQHADISSIGAGRYSFWAGELRFTSRDNADPNSDGRTYRATYPVVLHPAALWAMGLALGLLLAQFPTVFILPAVIVLASVSRRCWNLVAALRQAQVDGAVVRRQSRLLSWGQSVPGRLVLWSWSALLVGALSLELGYWTDSKTLAPPYANPGGHQWLAKLQLELPLPGVFVIDTDSTSTPTASRLQLTDTLGALGPAHSLHADISSVGEARYSHWSGHLRFATRDNADPNTDGRIYRVTYPIVVHPAALWILVLVQIALLVGFIEIYARPLRAIPTPIILPFTRLYRAHGLASALCLTVGIGFFWATLAGLPYAVVTVPDSQSYVAFANFRTAGYPLFVLANIALFGSPYAVVVSQFALAALAIAYLAWVVERHYGFLVAAATCLPLLVHGSLLLYHYAIMTESLAFSLNCVFLGLGLQVLHTARSTKLVLAIAATVLASMLVRPAFIGLMPALLVLLFPATSMLMRRCFIFAMATALAMGANSLVQPLVVALMRTNAGDVVRHAAALNLSEAEWNARTPESVLGKIAGFSLFGQAGFVLDAQVNTRYPELRDHLLHEVVPVQELYKAGTSMEERALAAINHNNTVTWVATGAALAAWQPGLPYVEYDHILSRLSLEIILQRPVAFALLTMDKLAYAIRHTWLGYFWANEDLAPYLRRAADTDSMGKTWISRYGLSADIPETAPIPGAHVRGYFPPAAWIGPITLAFATSLIATWLICCVRRRAMSPTVRGLAFAAVGLVSCTLLISTVQAPLYRYGDPTGAFALFLLAGTVRAAVSWLVSRRAVTRLSAVVRAPA